VLQQTLY